MSPVTVFTCVRTLRLFMGFSAILQHSPIRCVPSRLQYGYSDSQRSYVDKEERSRWLLVGNLIPMSSCRAAARRGALRRDKLFRRPTLNT